MHTLAKRSHAVNCLESAALPESKASCLLKLVAECPSFAYVHPGGDPYDVSDAEGGSSHHPSTYHDEDYPRASPPQSPFEDEG